MHNNNQQNQNTKPAKKRVPPERQLAELIKDFDLFKDKNNVTYIKIEDYDAGFNPIGERIIRINSLDFREYLIDLMYQSFYKFPSKNTLESTLMRLSYRAKKFGALIEIYNRIGSDGYGNIYIDIVDNNQQIVKVTKNGWTVDQYPVIFTRYGHTAQLPTPQQGGNLKDLLQFIPIASVRDQCLLLCWLVASVIPNVERCFLLLEGPPGSAKSAVANRLKSLIDPMNGNRLTLTTKDSEVAQQLGQHCIPYFDNISNISRSISDLFCLCYSNSVYSKKALYTDDGTVTFNMSGNIIFTTTGIKKLRSDFLERTYKVEVPPRNSFASQKRLQEDFEKLQPTLFGALLDTLVAVLNKVDQIPEPVKYRTVDFDHYCAAAAEVLGYGQDLFWEARDHIEAIMNKGLIKSMPLIQALHTFLSIRNGYWTGCMTELLHELNLHADNPASLPQVPRSLSAALNKADTELQSAGITVTQLGHENCQVYEITLFGGQPVAQPNNTVPSSPQATSAVADLMDQIVSEQVQFVSDSPSDNPTIVSDDIVQESVINSSDVIGEGNNNAEMLAASSTQDQKIVLVSDLIESTIKPEPIRSMDQALGDMFDFIEGAQELKDGVNPFLVEDEPDDGDQDQ